MTTASDILLDLLREPGFGQQISVTTSTGAGTATTTSPVIARFANQTTFFEGKYLWIPGASAGADQVRTILSHSESAGTTTFTFEQTANFGENLSGETAYIIAVHPDTLFEYMTAAQESTHVVVDLPLYHLPASAGMQGGSVDTDWTETNGTDDVSVTASEIYAGAQALKLTDSGSGGGYTQSGLYSVGEKERVVQHFIGKSASGTFKDSLLDASGNELSSITTTQKRTVYGKKVLSVGATQLRKRLTVVTASGVGIADFSGAVRLGETLFRLPSWVGNRFTVEGVSRGIPHEMVTDSGSADELWLADSLEMRSLKKGVHWQVFKRSAAANTRFIRLLEAGAQFLEDPLFVHISCPWSAPYGVEALFDGYSATSQMPLDLAVAKTMAVMGKAQGWQDMQEAGEARLIRLLGQDEAEQNTEPEETDNGWARAFR